MLKDKRTRPIPTALLAVLFTGGLLLTLSARAVAADSRPSQATPPQEAGTPKQGALGSQSKVSPYAKMNRQHAQTREGVATTPPPPTASPAARKGKSGAAKKS